MKERKMDVSETDLSIRGACFLSRLRAYRVPKDEGEPREVLRPIVECKKKVSDQAYHSHGFNAYGSGKLTGLNKSAIAFPVLLIDLRPLELAVPLLVASTTTNDRK